MRYSVRIKGIVQGVGFRPFVFGLATALGLGGFIRNTAEGVSIEIEGSQTACGHFFTSLNGAAPPMAKIDGIEILEIEPKPDSGFKILLSEDGRCNTLISPDIGVCADCAREVLTEGNRRYLYPFTNCTNCGPRFTIVNDIPYDRKNTSMAVFPMCGDCQGEYENPHDRRFHAQPNACPVCGPRLSFTVGGEEAAGDIFRLFDQAVRSGNVVAVKGLGGYHLACGAGNAQAVAVLRERKRRFDKPFAVMMRDLAAVRKYCELSRSEEDLLTSPQKPIVLLKKKKDAPGIAPGVAPNNDRLGVMLPYTPLHLVLMRGFEALVMTSGNLSDEPMIYRDEEVPTLLPLADAVLTHNRRIVRRMDDSICVVVRGRTVFLRRARGYAPSPLKIPENRRTILALGAQQKNTFCLLKAENAFLSGHIGDLDDEAAERCLEREIEAFSLLFDAQPEILVCDKHPDYVSTRLTERLMPRLPVIKIQHHHAHFASVLAEHGMDSSAIGFIFDGTGYGDDGCVWGGEALYGTVAGSRRLGHLLYFPLLGGGAAIREPWRAALAVAERTTGEDAAAVLFPEYREASRVLLAAGRSGVNAPLTSSMGRLFDAVAALAGIRKTTTYEGQAATELQQCLDETETGAYRFEIFEEDGQLIFDWRPLIREVLADLKAGISAGVVSARFHRAVAELIVSSACALREKTGCPMVVLSGGVFQNDFLLDAAICGLEEKGFCVLTNEQVPINDGGISFGQAAAASCQVR